MIRASSRGAGPRDGRRRPEDLLDDVNTDVMTPAWVCFTTPEEIALDAYAGLVVDGKRLFPAARSTATSR